jgi:hypothetical protein
LVVVVQQMLLVPILFSRQLLLLAVEKVVIQPLEEMVGLAVVVGLVLMVAQEIPL